MIAPRHLSIAAVLVAASTLVAADEPLPPDVPMPDGADRPARLAIVADDGSGEIADLLTSALGETDGVVLLERSRIDALLVEQNLVQGSLTSDQSVRVGQLLGGDGVLMLSSSEADGAATLEVRLISVKSGVVVLSLRQPLKAAAVEGWSAMLADRIRESLDKLAVARKQAMPLSVLPLHFTAPSGQAAATEQAVTTLVRHRLSRRPHLFVLERQRMDLLARENVLAGQRNGFGPAVT